MTTAPLSKSYLLCLERLGSGTATIEYVMNDTDGTYIVRVQIHSIGHVLTGLTLPQLEKLQAAAQETP